MDDEGACCVSRSTNGQWRGRFLGFEGGLRTTVDDASEVRWALRHSVENVFSEPVPLDGGNLEILGLHECMMIHGSDISMHVHVNVNELYIRRRRPRAVRPTHAAIVGLGQRLTRGGSTSRVAFGLSLWSLVWGLRGRVRKANELYFVQSENGKVYKYINESGRDESFGLLRARRRSATRKRRIRI